MVVRTPLIRLQLDDAPAEIWLKLENLQPIGSFKLRGAANAVLSAPRDALSDGLVTTSTGNMAQGVAWMARELGVPATIVVPDNASAGKARRRRAAGWADRARAVGAVVGGRRRRRGARPR